MWRDIVMFNLWASIPLNWQSCAVLPTLQSVKFTGWTIVGLGVLEVLRRVDEDDATGE